MLLALIAAATPALCPGDLAYANEVSRAASLLGVRQQLYIQVVPNKTAPDANTRSAQKAIAWVYRGKLYDSTIYIRFDMRHAMSCAALRLSALHEVCHIAKGHVYQMPTREEAILEEEATDRCVQRFLSPREWEQSNADLTSAHYLTQRERIEPADPLQWELTFKQAVPR